MKSIFVLEAALGCEDRLGVQRVLPDRMHPEEIRDLLADGYRLAYAILRNRDDAHDCVLGAILRIARTDDVPRDVHSYFLRAVRTTAYDMLRRRKVARRCEARADDVEELLGAVASEDLNPCQQLQMNEVNEAIGIAVWKLPSEIRDPTILHYFKGFDIQEVAAYLHIPPGTVKSRLFRARSELANSLREYHIGM